MADLRKSINFLRSQPVRRGTSLLHARVPPFDLAKTIDENASSELRVAYGDDFWALHDVLGTTREYPHVVAD